MSEKPAPEVPPFVADCLEVLDSKNNRFKDLGCFEGLDHSTLCRDVRYFKRAALEGHPCKQVALLASEDAAAAVGEALEQASTLLTFLYVDGPEILRPRSDGLPELEVDNERTVQASAFISGLKAVVACLYRHLGLRTGLCLEGFQSSGKTTVLRKMCQLLLWGEDHDKLAEAFRTINEEASARGFTYDKAVFEFDARVQKPKLSGRWTTGVTDHELQATPFSPDPEAILNEKPSGAQHLYCIVRYGNQGFRDVYTTRGTSAEMRTLNLGNVVLVAHQEAEVEYDAVLFGQERLRELIEGFVKLVGEPTTRETALTTTDVLADVARVKTELASGQDGVDWPELRKRSFPTVTFSKVKTFRDFVDAVRKCEDPLKVADCLLPETGFPWEATVETSSLSCRFEGSKYPHLSDWRLVDMPGVRSASESDKGNAFVEALNGARSRGLGLSSIVCVVSEVGGWPELSYFEALNNRFEETWGRRLSADNLYLLLNKADRDLNPESAISVGQRLSTHWKRLPGCTVYLLSAEPEVFWKRYLDPGETFVNNIYSSTDGLTTEQVELVKEQVSRLSRLDSVRGFVDHLNKSNAGHSLEVRLFVEGVVRACEDALKAAEWVESWSLASSGGQELKLSMVEELVETNVVTPEALWRALQSETLDASGDLSFEDLPDAARRFYALWREYTVPDSWPEDQARGAYCGLVRTLVVHFSTSATLPHGAQPYQHFTLPLWRGLCKAVVRASKAGERLPVWLLYGEGARKCKVLVRQIKKCKESLEKVRDAVSP